MSPKSKNLLIVKKIILSRKMSARLSFCVVVFYTRMSTFVCVCSVPVFSHLRMLKILYEFNPFFIFRIKISLYL